MADIYGIVDDKGKAHNIADSEYTAWALFFTRPNFYGRNPNWREPVEEARRAYEAIGYRAVKLNVTQENENE